jgi:hypothetical protein
LVILKRGLVYLQYAILPVLTAIYPVFFHYGNNANLVSFSSVLRLSALFTAISVGIYILSLLALKGRGAQAAIVTFVFLLFFHTYGLAFNGLRGWDVLRVEQYSVLPVYILLGIYAAWWVSHVNDIFSKRLWTGASIVLAALILFNLARIVPTEIRKASSSSQEAIPVQSEPTASAGQSYPDIYYIVLDEMAGFDAMRQYWGYDGIDQFVNFLQNAGFYVAEESHASVAYTFYEMSSRLNYEARPYDPEHPFQNAPDDFNAWANNRVMQYLKSIGYTTIVYDERRDQAYPDAVPIQADYLYEQPTDNVMRGLGVFDDFGIFVTKNTMLQPLAIHFDLTSPKLLQHRNMILFTMESVSSKNVQSPKMVYVHLMLPHVPFMFEPDGSIVEPANQHNWDKYLGNYIYATHVAQEMIKNILSSANPANPPIIIFQSDHGARNIQESTTKVLLENYPEEYKTLIVNAMYLPGCDNVPLTQDMAPVNTFPIVFNCYFDAGIPLINR